MLLPWIFTGLGFLSGILHASRLPDDLWVHEECETVQIAECSGLVANAGISAFQTVYPNDLSGRGEDRWEQAIQLYDAFREPFRNISSHCSGLVVPFLCLTFAPVCDNKSGRGARPLPLCRSVCEDVKSACSDHLSASTGGWPERFECSELPENNVHGSPCTEAEDFYSLVDDIYRFPWTTTPEPTTQPPVIISCPKNHVPVVGAHSMFCAPDCVADTSFTRSEKNSVEIALIFLSVVTFCSALLTILTFLISLKSRFRYPERPVLFMAISYMFIALVYFHRLIVGREYACSSNALGQNHLAVGGSHNPAICTIQFVVTYFFEEAAYLWWIIAAVCWWLSVSRGWSSEALENISKYFHIVVWGISGACTAAVCLWKKIDTDEFSGMCSVGNFDKDALLYFVILPHISYLFVGGIITVACVIGSVKLRTVLRLEGNDPALIDRIDSLLWKFGLFCVLFTVFLAGFTACGITSFILHHSETDEEIRILRVTPVLSYARLILSAGLGIFVGGWVCNKKSFLEWKGFVSRRLRTSRKSRIMRIQSGEERMPLNHVDL